MLKTNLISVAALGGFVFLAFGSVIGGSRTSLNDVDQTPPPAAASVIVAD